MDFDRASLRAAFDQLGRLLAARGHDLRIVVIGGSALLLGGWVDRPTVDVDIVSLARPSGLVKARPLPRELAEAIDDVAALRGLPPQWMNSGPSDLMDWGLPEGLLERTAVEHYDGLTVHLASRVDLIFTKLYAAVDQGPASRHVDDLRALAPTDDELRSAAAWCRTQDPSEGFDAVLRDVLDHFGVEDDNDTG